MTNLICVEIDALADAFSSVNNSERITSKFNFYPSPNHPLVLFRPFYQQLGLVLTRDSPSNQQRKREPPPTTTPHTQIVLPSTDVPTTPPPSENPINPQYSPGSVATASSAAEEKAEHYTQAFVNAFVYGSHESLRQWLDPFVWYHERDYRVQHTYPAQDNSG